MTRYYVVVSDPSKGTEARHRVPHSLRPLFLRLWRALLDAFNEAK